MFILICGLPGVGKSFFAKVLAQRMDAQYLSSDSIRMKELEKRTYSEEEKTRIYERMVQEAAELLGKGKGVILDATFYLERYRQMMRDVAQMNNVDFFIIECVLDEDELKKRMGKRKGEKTESEADFAVYLKVKREFEAIVEEHLVIETSEQLEGNIEKAIEWIKGR
jgi:predicted kinase